MKLITVTHMREQRHNQNEFNYYSLERFFCLSCGKNDAFLPTKLTARGIASD